MAEPESKNPPPTLPAPRNPVGRPPKLTNEAREAICKSIAGGVYPETAAAKLGVGASTLRAWMRRGARELQAGVEDSIYAKFVTAIRIADAEAEERLTLWVSQAAQKYWIAGLAILERRWPGRWKRPTDDRENKRAIMEAVLRAVVDTIRLVHEARPGLTDDELVAYVFEHIELPFEDMPEPTSPRDAAAATPIVVQAPSPDHPSPPALGPVIDAEVVDSPGLEKQRQQEAEKVLKGDGKGKA